MAELEIRLDTDPQTGKKNVTIKYLSDEDALPMEHEEEHRRLVDKLIEGGALAAHELGKIRVEREGVDAPQGELESNPARESGGLSEDA